MKKSILALALTALCGSALADQTAVAVSGASSNASTSAQSNSSQGNEQNINFNGPDKVDNTTRYPGTQRVSTAPTIYAPGLNTTSPCMVAVSGGVSVVGFGVTGGSAVKDNHCAELETKRIRAGVAQALFSIGQPQAAAKVMCNDPEAAKALGDICSETPVAAPKEQTSLMEEKDLHPAAYTVVQPVPVPSIPDQGVPPSIITKPVVTN